MRWKSFVGIALLTATGCGSERPEVPLCDGADGLNLVVLAQGQPARDAVGGGVRVENGSPSFAVDGQCRYFMSGGWPGAGSVQGRDQGWRQGVVGDELRHTLEGLAGMADLSSINDCNQSPPVFDAPPVTVANTRSALVCTGRGRRGTAAFVAIQERAPALWMQGQRLDQDLHVVAVGGYSADGDPPVYDWPSELTLREYLVDQNSLFTDPVGRSKRVAAADAGPLREIRERFLQESRSRSGGFIGGMQMTDGEISAAVYLRDALPYEDERGLWPPLPEE